MANTPKNPWSAPKTVRKPNKIDETPAEFIEWYPGMKGPVEPPQKFDVGLSGGQLRS